MAFNLQGKNILLAITGGVAAYKSAELCREFKRGGANVRVVMTSGAQEFITPLTLQALSGQPVHTELLNPESEAGMGHIELAKWPDLIVVAPATANFIAKYAKGLADDLLSTLLLATLSPVVIVPAMNQAMWKNPLTQRNIDELSTLFKKNLLILGPEIGEQACGDNGPGRMMDPVGVLQGVGDHFSASDISVLSNKVVVITAGPTREAIDPVRYISNHSSGKMGYSLARTCHQLGAKVILVSGPCNLDPPAGVICRDVISAQEMLTAVMDEVNQKCDVFIGCAAVADYRPKDVKANKMKKSGDASDISLALEQNPDIVATVASLKVKPYTVGFAAETNDLLHYAQNKLKNKNLDMIIANDVSSPELGFNSDHNEVYVITSGKQQRLEKQTKQEIADKIIAQISQYL